MGLCPVIASFKLVIKSRTETITALILPSNSLSDRSNILGKYENKSGGVLGGVGAEITQGLQG